MSDASFAADYVISNTSFNSLARGAARPIGDGRYLVGSGEGFFELVDASASVRDFTAQSPDGFNTNTYDVFMRVVVEE